MHNHNNKEQEVLEEEASKMVQEVVMSRPPKLSQPHPYPYPWLLIRDPKEFERQVFCNILQDEYHICAIPELQDKDVICCIHEWLVLTDFSGDDSNKLSLLNILTMEEMQIPPSPITEGRPYCERVLSLSSKMDGGISWRILVFDPYNRKLMSCQLGDTDYIEQDIEIECGYISAAACLNNHVYFQASLDLDLYSADLTNRHLDLALVIDGYPVQELNHSLGGTHCQNYLVESRGELLMVLLTEYDNEVIDVSVFRADFNNRQWVRLEGGICDGVILLGDLGNCYSYPDASALGLKSNSIYYLQSNRRNLYVYDIQDHTISINLPCSLVKYVSCLTWMFIPNNPCFENQTWTSVRLLDHV